MAKHTIPLVRMTAEEWRTEARYDSETGDHWWLVRRRGRQLNRPAGSTVTTGTSPQTVRVIWINGRHEYAHVLAWLWMTGEWPDRTVDHIDLNPLNNRWSNLRLATRSEQNMNRKPKRPGLTGASLHKPSGLWQAYIKKDGKQISLGYFKTAKEAHEAYKAAAREMFGEFAHASLKKEPRR